MTKLSDQQIANYCKAAGFTSGGLVRAIAIVLAESGGDTRAINYNRNAQGLVTSVDRGMWQINNYYHQEVTDSCAYDAMCSSQQAYKISSHGEDFSQWATYTGGAYKAYMARGLAASGVGANNSPTPPPTPSTQNSSGGQGVGTQLLGFQPIAVADITSTQTLSVGQGSNAQAFRLILAWGILIAALLMLAKTRAGYAAIYYAEALILVFLFATQAQFFREALSPISQFTSPTGS